MGIGLSEQRAPRGDRHPAIVYGVTVAAVGLALLSRMALDPILGDHLPYPTFYVAVATAAWLGGLRPALLASALGFLGAMYLFVPPRNSVLGTTGPHLFGLFLYVAVSATIAGFAEAMRRTQRRYAEQKERLRTTLASIGDAVITTDLDGRVTNLNAVAESLTGWSNAEAQGQRLDDVFRIINESTRKGVESPATRALRDGVIVGLANHTLLIAKDGTERPIDDSAAPIRCKLGEVVGCVLVFRDISERKAAENRLSEQAQLLRAVTDTTPDLVFVKDRDCRLTFANPATLAVMGKTEQEAIGGDPSVTFNDPAEIDPIVAADRRVMETGRAETVEEVFTGPNGTQTFLSMKSPLRDEQGEVIGVVGISHDITQRRRAESLGAGQNRVLEMAAVGRPLSEVLAALCGMIEQQEPSLSCSILLTDDDGRHTGQAIGSGLPRSYLNRLERLPLDPPYIGSCGEALDRGESIVVPDLRADTRYPPEWREHLLNHGLRSCRSMPVLGEGGRVLASFALYRATTGDPAPANKQLAAVATHIAGIAIERKRAEERLQASETVFRTLGESLPDFLWMSDAEGRPIYQNPAWRAYTGLTTDDLLRDGWQKMPHPDELPMLQKQWDQAVKDRAAFQVEYRCRRRDGAYRWFLSRTVPIKDDAGRVVKWVGTATDIHDHKLAEARLRASEARYRGLFEAIDEGFCVVEIEFDHRDRPIDYQIVEANPAFQRHTGLENFLGKSIRQLLPDLEEFWFETYGGVARTGQPTRFAHQAEPLGQRWFDVYAFRLGGDDSRRVAILFTDISSRIKIEHERETLLEQLRETDRRKDEFLATLAHELRNPLAPLRNGLQVMKVAKADAHAVEQARTMMERQLGQMVHLIDDLMDLSRVSRGKVELRKQRVELSKIVHQAFETSRPAIEAGGHDFAIDLPPEPITVNADSTRLAQVFSNLLNNAAKYTDRGGRIQLTIVRAEDRATVIVKDNGVGIPAAMLPRVFDMFTQIDHSLEKAQGGLGIGLSLVKKLVEMHGGAVEARSDGHGLGSEFVVTLPVVASNAGEAESPDALAATPATQRRKILIADDNVDAAASLCMLLEILGNEICVVNDGEAAVKAAGEFRPDIVLLDIGMPKLNGLEAARRIRQLPGGGGMILIALTGWGQDDDRRRTTEAGFNHHLVKPVDPATLERLLASLKTAAG